MIERSDVEQVGSIFMFFRIAYGLACVLQGVEELSVHFNNIVYIDESELDDGEMTRTTSNDGVREVVGDEGEEE